MTALIGFIFAGATTVPIACYWGRNGRLRDTELPWNLVELASRQVVILSGLAAFAVTNIVLLVTLARNRGDAAADSFDAVVTMFLVAYFFYVGTGVLMAYMPRDDRLSPLRPRVQFAVASVLQYRTIFLGWFAMKPLVEAFELDVPAEALQWLLCISAIIGTLFTGATIHRLGVLETREVIHLPLFAISAVLVYAAVITVFGLAPSKDSALHVAAIFFFLNTLTFVHFTVGIAAGSLPALSGFLDKWARYLVLADMQSTTVLIAVLFLTVVNIL